MHGRRSKSDSVFIPIDFILGKNDTANKAKAPTRPKVKTIFSVPCSACPPNPNTQPSRKCARISAPLPIDWITAEQRRSKLLLAWDKGRDQRVATESGNVVALKR